MSHAFDTIYSSNPRQLAAVADSSRDVVFLSTGFDPASKHAPHPPRRLQLTAASRELLHESARVLDVGGWLFIYGLPEELPFWAESADRTLAFKYWIALDIDDATAGKTLKPSHLGVLMLHKTGEDGKPAAPKLDVDAARSPHQFCAACKNTLKDWGGKKHLMNPKGAALSDVWRDLPRRAIRDNILPEDVLARLASLAAAKATGTLHMVQTGRGVEARSSKPDSAHDIKVGSSTERFTKVAMDSVHEGDCIAFLRRVKELHPRGLFDLVFADPPYNLDKRYSSHDDGMADERYIEWCDAWLDGMAGTLKPGGSLFVLNLPKWALRHATFLGARLEFRHWIAWDALSDPRGKIMPAHYALLWFTKPGDKVTFNHPLHGAPPRRDDVQPPDAPKYCLRASCIRNRKAIGDDDKADLTDIWWDIHRIKHKRDRDSHPCQLPEKLMERIIRLTTRPGDVVFDPFGGAGTTAIAAAKLQRRFVVTEIDPRYAWITREKLDAMREHADMFGEFVVPRKPTTKRKTDVTKRDVERYLQSLASRLKRIPSEADVMEDNPGLLTEIDLLYKNRGAALKRAKLGLVD